MTEKEMNDPENYRFSGDITSMEPLTNDVIIQRAWEEHGQAIFELYMRQWKKHNDSFSSS